MALANWRTIFNKSGLAPHLTNKSTLKQVWTWTLRNTYAVIVHKKRNSIISRAQLFVQISISNSWGQRIRFNMPFKRSHFIQTTQYKLQLIFRTKYSELIAKLDIILWWNITPNQHRNCSKKEITFEFRRKCSLSL